MEIGSEIQKFKNKKGQPVVANLLKLFW
jgi:hypothetical protein